MYTKESYYGLDFDPEDLYTRTNPMREIMKKLSPNTIGGSPVESAEEKKYSYKGERYTLSELASVTSLPEEEIKQVLAGHYYAKTVDSYIDQAIKSRLRWGSFLWRGNRWKLSDLSRVTGISVENLKQSVGCNLDQKDITDIVKVDFDELAKSESVMQRYYMYGVKWYTLADLSNMLSIAPADLIKHICDNGPSKSINNWVDTVKPRLTKRIVYIYEGVEVTASMLARRVGVDEPSVTRWLEDKAVGEDVTHYINENLHSYDVKHTYLWRGQRLNIREISIWSNHTTRFVRRTLRGKYTYMDITHLVPSGWFMYPADYKFLDYEYEYDGETLTVKELSSRLHLPADNVLVALRLNDDQKDIRDALSDFISAHTSNEGYYLYCGQLMSKASIAKEVGVTENVASIWLDKYMPGCVADVVVELGVRELLRCKYYRYEGMLLGKVQIANKVGRSVEDVEERLSAIMPGTDITNVF